MTDWNSEIVKRDMTPREEQDCRKGLEKIKKILSTIKSRHKIIFFKKPVRIKVWNPLWYSKNRLKYPNFLTMFKVWLSCFFWQYDKNRHCLPMVFAIESICDALNNKETFEKLVSLGVQEFIIVNGLMNNVGILNWCGKKAEPGCYILGQDGKIGYHRWVEEDSETQPTTTTPSLQGVILKRLGIS